jgi:hypothetical protein
LNRLFKFNIELRIWLIGRKILKVLKLGFKKREKRILSYSRMSIEPPSHFNCRCVAIKKDRDS